jgi:UDP-glucuronate 4-epimerase
VIEQRPPREEDLPVTCADLTKAKRLLGYEPRVPLTEGISDYVDWFRAAACVG